MKVIKSVCMVASHLDITGPHSTTPHEPCLSLSFLPAQIGTHFPPESAVFFFFSRGVDCCIANSWLSGFMDHEEAAKGTINDRLQAG